MAEILPPIPYDQPPTSFEWIDWYTKLINLVNSGSFPHNSLTGLQGGTSGEYYHMDNTDYTALAGTRITKGTDTTDDVIIDLATKGLVLKDTQGTPHYWRVTISNVGALVTTDLGTSKP